MTHHSTSSTSSAGASDPGAEHLCVDHPNPKCLPTVPIGSKYVENHGQQRMVDGGAQIELLESGKASLVGANTLLIFREFIKDWFVGNRRAERSDKRRKIKRITHFMTTWLVYGPELYLIVRSCWLFAQLNGERKLGGIGTTPQAHQYGI